MNKIMNKNLLSFKWFQIIGFCIGYLHFTPILAASNVELSVWVNEAIVASYTLDHEHFVQQEKDLAKYFTSDGWIEYSRALQASNLPQQIKTNAYTVTAVATLPPTIKSIDPKGWEATMPILVIYKNPAYSQKQELNITLRFIESTNQGVRGFAITSLKSIPIATPCRCAKGEQPVTIV